MTSPGVIFLDSTQRSSRATVFTILSSYSHDKKLVEWPFMNTTEEILKNPAETFFFPVSGTALLLLDLLILLEIAQIQLAS